MPYTALAVLLGFFGIALLSLGCHRLMSRRPWAATGNILGGFVLLAGGGLLYLLSLNLQTYTSFDSVAPIAELTFNKVGNRSYRATLMRLPGGELQVFTLNGDEWRLDARVLEWHGWANTLGLTRQLRLERISGYSRAADPSGSPHEYSLSNNPGFDLWQWVSDDPQRLPVVRAASSHSTAVPVTDGMRHRVTMSRTGLLTQRIGADDPQESK